MRHLLSILLLLLLAGRAGAVDYYADDSGSNTAPYDTWAKAATDPASAITRGNTDADGDGTHRLFIGPGTYSTALVLTDTDWASGTIFGVSQAGVTANAAGNAALSYPATKKEIVISKTSGIAVNVTVASVTAKNISATNTGAFAAWAVTADAFTGDNLDCYTSANALFSAAGATNFVVTRSRFSGPTGASGVIVSTTASGTFSGCVFDHGASGFFGSAQGINYTSSGDLNLYGCFVGGGATDTILAAGTGTLAITNCIVWPGDTPTTAYGIHKTGGTVNITTSLLIPHLYTHDIFSGAPDVDTGNIKTGPPGWSAYQRPGIIIPRVDDSDNIDYMASLSAELVARGMKGTYAVSAKDAAANASALQNLFDDGMGIAAHGYSHIALDVTGNIYSITKANATVNVDRTAGTITVVDQDKTEHVVTGFKAKTLGAIKTELEGFGCTVGSYATYINGDALGEIMAGSAGAQASPYSPQVLVDATCATGIYKTELVDSLAAMESAITGYDATIFITPYSHTSAGIRAAAKLAGWSALSGPLRASIRLTSVNVFNVGCLEVHGFLTNDTPSTATLQARTRDLCESVLAHGLVMTLLSHNATECTIAQWRIILDVMAEYSSLTVTSFDEALDTIQTSGLWSTSDDITYVRSWADSGNYHLMSSSPLIDTGTDLGAGASYLDMDGLNPDSMGDGWDMGAQQYEVYALTITAENGSVTKDPDLDWYPADTVVTLTAVPAENYGFSSWGGALGGSTNPTTITMSEARSVTANFTLLPPLAATTPSPANEAVDVALDVELSWVDGGRAATYDVYFGTDSTPDASEFIDNRAGTTYAPATDLAPYQTYYWRIDSVNASGTTTGTVWSFRTEAKGGAGVLLNLLALP